MTKLARRKRLLVLETPYAIRGRALIVQGEPRYPCLSELEAVPLDVIGDINSRPQGRHPWNC